MVEDRALVIAVLGAESTGKTTLVLSLVSALAAGHGLRVAGVAEVLREWCDREQRTPRREEQAAILAEQHRRITAAAAAHDVVISDTSALMTSVYSERLFGDASLREEALELHRSQVRVTLLTALDLPWVADGHQRDGEQVRVPVDDALRALLAGSGLPYAVVAGRGPARLECALAALAPALRAAGTAKAQAPPRAPARLFTKLDAGQPPAWSCACCSVPEFERALMSNTDRSPLDPR
jgi:nicotinamide riboside kinase